MIVVVGITTVDFFVSGLEHIPAFGGDEFHADNLVYCTQPVRPVLGGNGANSALVLATLGTEVALNSSVGADVAGELACRWLSDRGVQLQTMQRSASATATNAVVTDGALNRISFFHMGASEALALDSSAVDEELSDGALLLSGIPLMPALRPDGFASLLARARSRRAMTAVDIGPAIGRPVELAELAPLLPSIDYLLMNAYELSVCTGCSELEDGVEQLLNAGAHHVIVKRGRAGALLRCRDVRIEHPGYVVDATFTVGAGDAFNAGLLFALLGGQSQQQALGFANATAALVVASGQGTLGCPDRSEIEQFIFENPTQQES